VKEIRFNRADKDFAYLLNGEIVGYAPTYLQAEQQLNELVYALLSRPNVDAADLTPDEAADVLGAFTQVAAEEQAAAAEADAQAFLEAEEVRAGVEETLPRRVLVPNDPEPVAVQRVIDGLIFDVTPDGLFITRPDAMPIALDPLQAVALLTFIQSPNVAAIVSQYERAMQNAQWFTFDDEFTQGADARRWRPEDELPRGLARLELISSESLLQLAADAERRGREQGAHDTMTLIRNELAKEAA
jgi:hypothetical protein